MAGYRNLCHLLTTGKRRAPKGECHLTLADVTQHHGSLLAVARYRGAVPHESNATAHASAHAFLVSLARVLDDDRLSLAITRTYAHDDTARGAFLSALSESAGIPLVATNDAHSHTPDRRMLQDVLVCIRHGCTLAEAGYRLHANAERHLKTPEEMHRLFADLPRAVARTVQIATRAAFSLNELRYEYPDEVVPAGTTPQQHLANLTWAGAADRYPGEGGVPNRVRQQIENELALIADLNYASYFLTVHDLVRFARSGEEHPGGTPREGWPGPILCQGRGAAANSAVCYCLGITSVDPSRISLLFERFISKERNEPPDIDIDFEHERREEVIQYIYRKYGRERAALTAEVISYRRRSAVRDVGKALGLSLDLVDTLAKDGDWWDQGAVDATQLRALGLNPADPTLQWLARLTGEILGFPRHLSQHVGGFVITRTPLCELVPVENAAMPDRTVIEWDKDDVDSAGMLKVDVLGLGMLTAIRKCLTLVNAAPAHHIGGRPVEMHTIPHEDPDTYAMIQKADTVGVFQIESRAQMSMLPRLRPRCFYDLVIEVAIVRPGPIQGDMVHPYLRRRAGEEPVTFPNDAVREVLGRTLGVPLFQEQAMQLAIVAAGFTPGQADSLRRAMAAWKRKGDLIYRFGGQLIKGMLARGYPREFAERCFEQIKGFSEYGFPESHAASFALLVYVSAWLKRHYPAHFAAAIINSQPMGFYAPAQLVRDAKEHGVEVRPVDVLHSAWDCTIEHNGAGRAALRLGMRLVSGASKPETDKVERAAREHAPPRTMLELWRRTGASAATFRRLANADAFGSMGLSRQQALWHARLLKDDKLPLFESCEEADDAPLVLPAIAPDRQTSQDYASVGLSLKAHPLSFVREHLRAKGVAPCTDLLHAARTPNGAAISVAGLVLVRQRPGTASGVVFITLEDETGIANLILWSRTFEKYRKVARLSTTLIATGRVQREGEVVHVHVSRIATVDGLLPRVRSKSRDFH
jgi:error-prone DNA polymerase